MRPAAGWRSPPQGARVPGRTEPRARDVSLYNTILDVLDTRSFATLWYWIALLAFWHAAGARVLGIPHDLLLDARRSEAASSDLHAMTRIAVSRTLGIGQGAGMVLAGLTGFVVGSLFVLGFSFGLELAQAVFFFVLPMCVLTLLRLRLARRIAREAPEGEALAQLLLRHRFWVQLIGMIAVFLTVLWGMWHSLTTGVLGN